MASGHVNRANRPNTWAHRPILQREESSCQLGAVHTWGKTGKHLLALSFSGFDLLRRWPAHKTTLLSHQISFF